MNATASVFAICLMETIATEQRQVEPYWRTPPSPIGCCRDLQTKGRREIQIRRAHPLTNLVVMRQAEATANTNALLLSTQCISTIRPTAKAAIDAIESLTVPTRAIHGTLRRAGP
mmetsp:Transcript_32193/g.73771  ORF Transcript_32193/g.73771 Transcript_32193/m.73771 type:complete len:115 (+) Transcript_32193:99-443(+)